MRDGKIIGVGTNLAVPKGVRVIDGKGLQVYPGMIDAATEIGLEEVHGVPVTMDITAVSYTHLRKRPGFARMASYTRRS